MPRLPLVAAVILLGSAVLLSGCGKPGRPQRPEGSTFPESYPSKTLEPTEASKTQAQTKANQGDFIDPSAKQPLAGTRDFIHQNINYQSQSSSDSVMDKGFGAPSASPAADNRP